MITKYGVVTEKHELCPLCGSALNRETSPPTCPIHGTVGIEKSGETDAKNEKNDKDNEDGA